MIKITKDFLEKCDFKRATRKEAYKAYNFFEWAEKTNRVPLELQRKVKKLKCKLK